MAYVKSDAFRSPNLLPVKSKDCNLFFYYKKNCIKNKEFNHLNLF